jgi:hypothetical protein
MPRQYLSNMNIKRIIKEEMDEFDWIRETNINPWLDYNYILIDVTPTEENIELLINLQLRKQYEKIPKILIKISLPKSRYI